MSASPPEYEEPVSALSDPADMKAWRAHPEFHLDRIEAHLRFHGRNDDLPEIRQFVDMILRIAPRTPVEEVAFKVIEAAREAERDAVADGPKRMQAREQVAKLFKAIKRLRKVRERLSEKGLGEGTIFLLAEHLGIEPLLARTNDALWAMMFDEEERLKEFHAALASPGMTPGRVRRLADRLIPVFQQTTGKPPTVTRRSGTGDPDSGPWVEFIAASAALAGITAQPNEIANAARSAAQSKKSDTK